MLNLTSKWLRWMWMLALVVSTSASGTLFHSAKEIRGQVAAASSEARTSTPCSLLISSSRASTFGVTTPANGDSVAFIACN